MKSLYSHHPANSTAFESNFVNTSYRESTSSATLRRSYSHHSASSSSSASASSSPISRSPPVQIYDLDFLELETSSSSSSLTSSSDYEQQHVMLGHHHHGPNAASSDDETFHRRGATVTTTSSSSSKSSSIKPHSQNNENRMSSRSSITTNSSFHSSSGSTSSANTESDEAFTFQDFISSIINDNEVEWSKLIVQDLARLLELKFREFKKSVALLNSNKSAPIRNFITNTSISLDVDTDLFTKIAQKVLELASEEPNGILGARIRLRIMCEGGQCYDMCQCFAYDSNTMATSEITVTIKEDIRSLKKLLQTFKLYSNFSKYVSLHVDSNNFDIIKKRLY